MNWCRENLTFVCDVRASLSGQLSLRPNHDIANTDDYITSDLLHQWLRETFCCPATYSTPCKTYVPLIANQLELSYMCPNKKQVTVKNHKTIVQFTTLTRRNRFVQSAPAIWSCRLIFWYQHLADRAQFDISGYWHALSVTYIPRLNDSLRFSGLATLRW